MAFHHGYTNTDRKMRLYNRLDRWSLPKADIVVTVCNPFADELAAAMGVSKIKLRVQHNAMRPRAEPHAGDVRSLQQQLALSTNQSVILSVGRLSKEKGHADLLECFRQLCEEHPHLDCKLVIVGDGPERESLLANARASGVNERIVFTGQVADVAPFYAIADVCVLPSHSEGSPNVLLEAMAARVPVVATNVGGVPEIVEDEKSALLVPPGEPSSLAAGIARVLHDSNLQSRLTEAAAALVVKNHSAKDYAQSIMRIYEMAVSSRRT